MQQWIALLLEATMLDTNDKVVCSFPPRPLTRAERQLLLDWTDASGDYSSFISERRSDDPTIYGRIVVQRRATNQYLYLVHCPRGSSWWIVLSAVTGENVGHFATLRAALDFLKPPAQRRQMEMFGTQRRP